MSGEGERMTKQEALDKAIERLDETGFTQYVLRRGSEYKTFSSDYPHPRGWKVAEMISEGNVHAYRKSYRGEQ